MVGRHGIAHEHQHARVVNLLQRLRRGGQVNEEGWLLDIGGVVTPAIDLAVRHRDGVPRLVAVVDVGVLLGVHIRLECSGNRVRNFLLCRPKIPQVDRFAMRIDRQWLVYQIDVDTARDSIRHHQRWRRKVVRAHVGVDAAFKVAVTAQHGGGNQLVLIDHTGHGCGQRSAVADAGRAAIAHHVEAEFLQVR